MKYSGSTASVTSSAPAALLSCYYYCSVLLRRAVSSSSCQSPEYIIRLMTSVEQKSKTSPRLRRTSHPCAADTQTVLKKVETKEKREHKNPSGVLSFGPKKVHLCFCPDQPIRVGGTLASCLRKITTARTDHRLPETCASSKVKYDLSFIRGQAKPTQQHSRATQASTTAHTKLTIVSNCSSSSRGKELL